MEKDDFKLYSLIVGEGSGCFFQPMTTDYSYILTAKHVLFEKKIDDRGKEYFQEFKNELKQSTKLWLVFLITLVVLVMDVIIVGSHNILALRFRNG